MKYIITEIETINLDRPGYPQITCVEIANSLDQAKDIYNRLVSNMLQLSSHNGHYFDNFSDTECRIICPRETGEIVYSYAITEPNKVHY